VFIGLDAAAAESGHAWEGFLTDLGERGLGCPLLLISDGGTRAERGRRTHDGCSAAPALPDPRRPNVLAKVPKNAQGEVKADYWAIFEVPEPVHPGPDTVRFVQARIHAFATR